VGLIVGAVGLMARCGWFASRLRFGFDGPLRFRRPARGGQSARFTAFVRMLRVLVIVSMCHCACSFLVDVTSTSIERRSAAASELVFRS
jgi:hypothetical protein